MVGSIKDARLQKSHDATLARLSEQVKGALRNSTPEKLAELGRQIWAVDLSLHEVDIGSEGARSLAKLLPPSEAGAVIDAWYGAQDEPLHKHGFQRLAEHVRSQKIDGQRVVLGVDPNMGDNNNTFVLGAAYETHQKARIDLVFEQGAQVGRFKGTSKCAGLGAKEKKALLAELHARHFGVKGAEVKNGTVVISVGNRFETAYVDAIDRLVKRDVGDVPVRVVINNRGDDPVASVLRGVQYSYMNDGTKIPYLDTHQAREMTDRFRDLGVVQISSWPNDGTYIQVSHPTTKQQAEKILAAVLEHLPTDHVVVFSSARAPDRPVNAREPEAPPLGYVTAGDVLAGNAAFLEHGGASSLPQNQRDSYAGLRDSDLGR